MSPALRAWKSLLALECASLNLVHKTPEQKISEVEKTISGEDDGGFEFEGTLENVFKANLNARAASRVVVRLGEFYAAAFSELAKKTSSCNGVVISSPGNRLIYGRSATNPNFIIQTQSLNVFSSAINHHFTLPAEIRLPVTTSNEGQMVLSDS